MQDQITIKQIFDNLSRTAPEIITRKKLHELTGGLVSEKSLANMDCIGDGILPRLKIGGKVAYPKKEAIAWLEQRCKIVQETVQALPKQ